MEHRPTIASIERALARCGASVHDNNSNTSNATSLDDWLRQDETTRVARAVPVLNQVALALQALHSTGIVHGDMRCSNIFVAPNEQVALGGFDHCFDYNALRFQLLGSDRATADVGITVPTLQSVRWLAPESVAGTVPTPASDVYAFGMAIYEAMTGDEPFAGVDAATVLELKRPQASSGYTSILASSSSLQLERRETLDRDEWSLIQDMTHANAMFRPSMQIVAMGLRSLCNKVPLPPPPSSTTTPSTMNSTTAANPVVSMAAAAVPGSTVNPHHDHQQQYRPHEDPSRLAQPGTALDRLRFAAAAAPTPSTAAPRATEEPATTQYAVPPKPSQVVYPMQGRTIVPVQDATATDRAHPAPRSIWTMSRLIKLAGFIVSSVAVAVIVPLAMPSSSTQDSSEPPQETPSPTSSSPSPTPTPQETPSLAPTPMPTPAPVYVVTTLASHFSSSSASAIVVSSQNMIFVSDEYRVYYFKEGSYPSVHAGQPSGGYVQACGDTAMFDGIRDMAIDTNDKVYVADSSNHRVRSFSATSTCVSNVFGDGVAAAMNGYTWEAQIDTPFGLALDASSNLYVSDKAQNSIRKLVATSSIVYAPLIFGFSNPESVVVGPSGEIFVTQTHVILRAPGDGFGPQLFVGDDSVWGFKDGVGSGARFNLIGGMILSPAGDALLVVDKDNHCIRRVVLATQEVTTFAGKCEQFGHDDGAALNARFYEPRDITLGPDGAIYVVERAGTVGRVRKLAALTP